MKNKLIILLMLLLSFSFARTQSWGDSTLKHQPLFYKVEEAPKFPGGVNGYYKFLAEHLKMPAISASGHPVREVRVRIILDSSGKVAFAEIEKGLKNGYDDAALEVMKLMPAWTPAKQNKYSVPISITLPVVFMQ